VRFKVIHLIQIAAPARPACFDSHGEWQQWLTDAHITGVRVMRRVDSGSKSLKRSTHYVVLPTERIDYCCDCTSIRRAAMQRQGRCSPSRAYSPPDPATPTAVTATSANT